MLILIGVTGCGEHEKPGTITKKPVPKSSVTYRVKNQQTAVKNLSWDTGQIKSSDRQILFGDLHLHTTFSTDAFAASLPILGGEGARPPADACDFARFCSNLDFWALTDHAEGLTPRHWRESINAVRQCQAVSGSPPDLISLMGFEWTQMSMNPEDHYGHKNVVYKDLTDTALPPRPISSRNPKKFNSSFSTKQKINLAFNSMASFTPEERKRILDLLTFLNEVRSVPICGENPESSTDCIEVAQMADEFFAEIKKRNNENLIIPHGTAWGNLTPSGGSWSNQNNQETRDPSRQKLIEVYSGHGNSEEYRSFRSVKYDTMGKPYCPDSTENFTPCCQQAGKIIQSRCENPDSEDCKKQVEKAELNFIKGGLAGRHTIPNTSAQDWKNCGVCQDCYSPAFRLRPKSSVQYIHSMFNEENKEGFQKYYMGFVASSDNHSARPGSGYKEFARQSMTDAQGPRSKEIGELVESFTSIQTEKSLSDTGIIPYETVRSGKLFKKLGSERQASFMTTGGLVATHAKERSRDAIWTALKERRVYGTSGDRILLWFNLNTPSTGTEPMGSIVDVNKPPTFSVKAVGSRKQKPGCPDYSEKRLGSKRINNLCRGECYNPSNERYTMDRIEIVRIRRGKNTIASPAKRIQDPWKTFECPENSSTCEVEFTDKKIPSSNGEVLYYARALQEPTPAINAGGLRCEYDENGNCEKINPCFGSYKTPPDDDCLESQQSRAWSSPIFVSHN